MERWETLALQVLQVFLVLLVTVRWDHQVLLVSRASLVYLDLQDHLEQRARMVVVTRQTV